MSAPRKTNYNSCTRTRHLSFRNSFIHSVSDHCTVFKFSILTDKKKLKTICSVSLLLKGLLYIQLKSGCWHLSRLSSFISHSSQWYSLQKFSNKNILISMILYLLIRFVDVAPLSSSARTVGVFNKANAVKI